VLPWRRSNLPVSRVNRGIKRGHRGDHAERVRKLPRRKRKKRAFCWNLSGTSASSRGASKLVLKSLRPDTRSPGPAMKGKPGYVGTSSDTSIFVNRLGKNIEKKKTRAVLVGWAENKGLMVRIPWGGMGKEQVDVGVNERGTNVRGGASKGRPATEIVQKGTKRRLIHLCRWRVATKGKVGEHHIERADPGLCENAYQRSRWEDQRGISPGCTHRSKA